MIGLTPREQELAAASAGPADGVCRALAELELYWINHQAGAPDVHELRLNIRIGAGDGIAGVQAIADWLGVPVTERYGCHIAQRRFGTSGDSVIVEAHYTPDQDEAHALVTAAAGERELAVA